MNGNTAPGAPKVFISSTVNDLEDYRAKAVEAARLAGFFPVLCGDWEAKDKPPLAECLERVGQTHLTLAIVAHRYGWVPEGQTRSVTWLECQQTQDGGNDLLVFMPDDSTPWPDTKKEAYRVFQAVTEGKSPDTIARLAQEVQRNSEGLVQFKTWLTGEKRIRNVFTSPDDFKAQAVSALKSWLDGHPAFKPGARPQADPEAYLRQLRESCAHIDIRGLQTGSGKAHRFPIEQLYIELDTAGGGKLRDVLNHPRRVVVGDPGCGKTTFLRWIANGLCREWLEGGAPTGEEESPPAPLLQRGEREVVDKRRGGLPVFVSIAEWLEHVRSARAQNLPGHPRTGNDPSWLVHYLADQGRSRGWGLDAAWFRERLQAGHCLLLFDGLDEAPDRKAREHAVRLLEQVAATWPDSPMLVTSRPAGYQDRSVLAGFEPSRIEPLSDGIVATFLGRWSAALHSDAAKAEAHRQELLQALNARPAIRRLARNTVMLTALAVVHWNEKRLPEQRAELYESILTWLARAREQRPGRAGPERSLEVLRSLALAMFKAPAGRQVQLTRHDAAEHVEKLFQDGRAQAEAFLEEEELDSGIVVKRGSELRFWHLSFQEYLAARAIGGLNEEEQRRVLLGGNRALFQPEWREVGQLLGGVLYEQGRAKVDGLVSAVLDDLDAAGEPALAEQARVAGLLGGIVRDLAPFNYAPDDKRYRRVLDAALGVFDKEQSKAVPVEDRIAAAEALGRAGDPRLADKRQYWVEIEGGRFWMGAQNSDPKGRNYDAEAYGNESPPHEVVVSGFRLGRWPVTVQEFADFIEDEGYIDERWWQAGGFGEWREPDGWEKQAEHPNRPVVCVSWHEAMAYCAWRTARPGLVDDLNGGFRIRLPTEAEWEWAARGVEPRRYPWGPEDCDQERLNYGGNVGAPTPVGVYPAGATPQGVLDLAGNVWEWCLDIYAEDYYRACFRQGGVPNSQGAVEGDYRVLRGGSWGYGPRCARSAYRCYFDPANRNDGVGFRLVCSSPITDL